MVLGTGPRQPWETVLTREGAGAPSSGVWREGARRKPRPLSKRSQEGRGWGRRRPLPQSFFRRLYISLLLFSPAHVRLLVRNFFKSSLKSSWCMGR